MKFAISLAGHDKGHIYYVVQEDKQYVYLADGSLKSMEHPKKKNRKHIQMITNLPAVVADTLGGEDHILDLQVKRAIKLYKQDRCR